MMPSLEPGTDNASAYRAGRVAALGTLLGIALSGPLSVALVNGTHPQPPWRDADLFSRNYHIVQLLPYAGGILLVASLILLVSSIHASASVGEKPRTGAALILTGGFAAFIFFNYVVQTRYVPDLARRYEPATAPIIAMLSMSNPRSLAWAIEMWGWGALLAAMAALALIAFGRRLRVLRRNEDARTERTRRARNASGPLAGNPSTR